MNAMRRRMMTVASATVLVALAGCGGGATTTAPAAPPPALPPAPQPPAPPAPPAASAPAPAAAPAPSPVAAEAAASPNGGEMPEGDEHRHGHHAGVVGLIVRSMQDLDVSPEQKAKLEALRAALLGKLEPARAAARDFSAALADGVAAGKIDRAKVDAKVAALVARAQAAHDASLQALDDLHAALTPEQRARLVDAMQTHWERWKEAHGRDEQGEPQHRSGYLLALVRDVGLNQDQAQKIKTALHDQMKAGPQEHAHKEVADHMAALSTAFKSDKFDAKKVAGGKAASGHMARWGAGRMVRFVEVALPVLTPEQRAKLATVLRERAGAPQG